MKNSAYDSGYRNPNARNPYRNGTDEYYEFEDGKEDAQMKSKVKGKVRRPRTSYEEEYEF